MSIAHMLVVGFFGIGLLVGCESGSESTEAPDSGQSDCVDSTDCSDAAADPNPEDIIGGTFTHKMMRSTGENMFAALGYECAECTFEQWLAIDPPEGWTKGPAQVLLASGGELRSNPSFDGVPDSMDFVPEIPGNEYELIVKNLDGRLISTGPGGLVVEAQVMRDTLLFFEAGRRVHELTDPEGNVFVLFAYGVDPADVVVPDFQNEDVLADLSAPEGWTYSTRILDEELALDTDGAATVLAIRGDTISTWEKR